MTSDSQSDDTKHYVFAYSLVTLWWQTPLPTDDGRIALVSKEIARVAEDMIAEHGNAAIVQADQRHKTWELIREIIRDTLKESATKKSHA